MRFLTSRNKMKYIKRLTLNLAVKLFIVIVIILCCIVASYSQIRNVKFPRIIEICYDAVGCFEIPRHHNPFQKLPEHPQVISTQFYLFRRDLNVSQPQILSYNNFEGLLKSKYHPKEDLKVIVHGYMTKWNEKGALAGMQAYLDISSCNVILVDWERGAQGPSYSSAAANTELVGRQLGLLLLQLISLGAQPKRIHLIGFSLGAHVSACASEVLKDRGLKIGRITGLDPASPLFKLNAFRGTQKKLDVSDADFVDIIHTDGSASLTDGFGLLQPLGHVDFFPNGGRQQPGCNDLKNSLVRSHFDKSLDRDIACSHIRAYHYFLETLLELASISKNSNSSGCSFVAYSCPGGPRDYALGRCFPINSLLRNNGQKQKVLGPVGLLGENARGSGVLYLTTRERSPFCGMQIQLIINVSAHTRRTKGYMLINLQHGVGSTNFTIFSDLTNTANRERRIFALTAVNFDTMQRKLENITINIYSEVKHIIFADKVQMKAMDGQSWKVCHPMDIQQNEICSIVLSTNNKC